MTGLIVIGCLILLIIIILQIGKVSELSAEIRGHEASVESSSRSNGILMLLYGILFFVGIIWFNFHMKNWLLGFGPHLPASEHGATLDSLFLWTTIITGIVFVLTHIALFWFTFKYRHRKGHKPSFMAHNTKLELIWTFVPSFVLTLLIIKGMVGWNQIMADTSVDDDYMEIEAMGQQFAWLLRYPGADGQLGDRNFRLISGSNPFGQDLSDKRNDDDFHPSEIVLPVGKKVRVRITARDVLHSFFIPHMRVKMDAVPGMPTYFVFTPTVTTKEYRERLKDYPEYQEPSDPDDPDGPKLWETFDYELACAELCGSGHYSMRRVVRIVEQDEYDAWVKEQKPWK